MVEAVTSQSTQAAISQLWGLMFWKMLRDDAFNLLGVACELWQGEKAPIHCKGRVHLWVGNLIMTHQMWVADIQNEFLLGLDLECHNCLVNLKDHCQRIGSQEIPLKKSKGETPPSCCWALLSKDVLIPPFLRPLFLSEPMVPTLTVSGNNGVNETNRSTHGWCITRKNTCWHSSP